ncbi:acetyl-CoA hydrolase/transferase C-terminal domain-containing protein [uncultured Eubacterium sp.]|uniref:acetyl-CoA hydrolase/transferase family protein n=1 Tax=uncultured Eubacterium sp. TaxID=165185 RepID=UPI0025EF40D7|nr:acetyl-CoA hydrolase/transferase C-terminal domain-containing protein [uncultured Eubacterium sp.]
MTWQEIYQSKLTTAEEAIKLIHDGDKIVTGFACGEPIHIEKTLAAHYKEYKNLEIINMLTLVESPWAMQEFKGHIKLNTLFASKSTRASVNSGDSEFTTSHFYEIPDIIENYICPRVSIVMVSPPDEHGYVSFGTTVDYTKGTTDYCEVVIAQVNKHMPRTFGNSIKHVRDFTCFVEYDEQLPEVVGGELSEVDLEIGRYCASLINDGDCLQLGIGGIPNAVCLQLTDKKDLGLHSELVGDGVVPLLESGVINNKKKQTNVGRTVLGAAFGSRILCDYINNNPSVELHPIDYVNNPIEIAKNDNMVSINSCLQIDLLGQVVSDTIGLSQFSAVGGQVDFVRGATMSKGGRSIIAMPATAKHGTVSRIVPIITEGSAVTTPRNDVNYVVTEYGIAQLKGKTLKERAKALIRIAHPSFRPYLMAEYKKRFSEAPFTDEELKQFKQSIIDKLHSDKEKLKSTIEQKIEKLINE